MRPVLSIALALAVLVASRHASADEGPATAPAPAPPKKTAAHAFVEGGAAFGVLFGLGTVTGSVQGGAALDLSPRFGITLGADVELGKTSDGALPLGEVASFLVFETKASALRFGIGPQLSYFWIERARAAENSPIDALGIGVRARLTVDLVRLDGEPATGRALYFSAAPTFEFFTGSAVTWRGSATLGVRF